jgi:hypothetical protein
MPGSAITPQWVVNAILDELLNDCTLINKADRSYDPQFKIKGAKVGTTIQGRLPQRPRAASGAALNKQPMIDRTFEVKITDQANIGFELSSHTLTLERSDIMRTCVKPCANALVQYAEKQGFTRLYKKIPNSIGTLGTSPTANLTYSQGVAKLIDLMGNNDDLCAILSPDQSAVLADAQKAHANPGFGVKEALRKGQFVGPNYLGVAEWYASPNVALHTSGGSTTATPLVNVAGGVLEGATSVVTDGWGSGNTTITEGDIFTFASVFEINSANFESTGRLRQFTATAATTDSSGAVTLNFTPPMYAAATPNQNVTAMAADNATITYWAMSAGGTQAATTSRQGLIFAPGTVILASADAEKVDAPVCVFAQDDEAGISLRLTKSYGIDSDNNTARLDWFFGWSLARPEWGALRVQGA